MASGGARGRRSRRRPRAVVLGGGIAGLASALLLARRSYRVVVLERDIRPHAASPEEAFRLWARAGAPQFRHSHVFLARLTCALRERFPEVLARLRRGGALELPLTAAPPPGLDLGPRRKGDGELVLLGCRRAALEWALREEAAATPAIELREGVLVEGLRAQAAGTAAAKRVAAVELRSLGRLGARPPASVPWRPAPERPAPLGPLRTVAADLVVDASGRSSRAPAWLSRLGLPSPAEKAVPTGIFYFTRFYRLVGRRPPGASTGLVGGDLGWVKLATFPGDGDTFSITIGTSIEDRPLRALRDPRAFEALLGAFPQMRVWRAGGVSEPIDGADTPVLVMGGLSNRLRRFLADGAPLLEGYFAVGDSACLSNPIYGRGATSAVLSAIALDDALSRHGSDLRAVAADYERRLRDEVVPFWAAAAASDRLAAARSGPAGGGAWPWLLGAAAREWLREPSRQLARLAGWATAAYFDRGLIPAARQDPTVYRALMRVMNMLDDPRSGLLAPEVVSRVLPYVAGALLRGEAPAFPGPDREQALRIVERACRPPAARKRPRNSRPAARRQRAGARA